MATFNYTDSLKYEVEKDYINNYSKIPLDFGISSAVSESETSKKTEQGGRFSILKSRISLRVSKRCRRENYVIGVHVMF